MYRIQAYNHVKQYFNITMVRTMEERKALIDQLLASGEYDRAGISFEWLAR
jgi:hypothetical protein